MRDPDRAAIATDDHLCTPIGDTAMPKHVRALVLAALIACGAATAHQATATPSASAAGPQCAMCWTRG